MSLSDQIRARLEANEATVMSPIALAYSRDMYVQAIRNVLDDCDRLARDGGMNSSVADHFTRLLAAGLGIEDGAR